MAEANSRTNQIATILAIGAGLLALSAALITYIRSGRIDVAVIVAGIAIPCIIISAVKARSVKKN